MHSVPQPDNMLKRPSLLLRKGRRAATTLAPNLTLRMLVFNLIANAALYLFYQLTPYSITLQAFNRDVLWRWGL